MDKKYFVWKLIVSLIFFSVCNACAQDNSQEVIETERIIEAFEVDETTWFKNSKGVIGKYDLKSGDIIWPFSETVFVDLAVHDGSLFGLKRSAVSEQPEYFLINVLSGKTVSPKLTLSDDWPFVVTANANFVYVISRKSVSVLDTSKKAAEWETRTLLKPLDYAPQMSAVATQSGLIYFGRNKGEWGGGLRTIDPATGAVEVIQEKQEGGCGDLLFPACDPVPSVILHPTEPDCVIAAMGLSHFFTRGAVVTVCDGDITDVYRELKTKSFENGREYTYELPFFDIVKTDKGWLAATYGQYVQNTAGGLSVKSYPEFPTSTGISHARLDNGFIILTSDVNWGMSLSGATPLIVRKIR